jgi:quercetin dioxygenase-like cupin family protein/catechol 2,3-dioxygenase-like lactoylglutathione lyase family enzyme
MTTSVVGSAPSVPVQRQLSTERETSRAWWFLGTLAVVRNPEGAPRTPAVVELVIPPGGSPPRHVHESLDDSFLMLEGEVVVRCGEQTIIGRAGSYVSMPAGVEHTFRVTSARPARMLLVHADDSFLSFIEAVGTPATELTLPAGDDPGLDYDELARLSAAHGSPFVGPSLDDDEARSFLSSTPSGLGAVHHVSLQATDVRRSEQWYVNAFGLIRVDGEIAEDGTGHVVLVSPTGGWMLSIGTAEQAAVEHVAIGCDSRDALVKWRDDLEERGSAPGTITDAPYGSGFVLRDPDGIEVELFAPPA